MGNKGRKGTRRRTASPPVLDQKKAEQPDRNDPFTLNIGILQIAVPVFIAIIAAPLSGRTGLLYLGGTLLVLAAVNFGVRFFTGRGLWKKPWFFGSCAVVGALALIVALVLMSPKRVLPPGPLPTVANTDLAGPAYSYLDKATADMQDIDVGFQYQGYVRQTFGASGQQIASVAVIVSRAATSLPGFDPEAIGHVRLTLWRVGSDNTKTAQLPLSPTDSHREEVAIDGGIRAMAGPDHGDTVIAFDPVATRPGERLAFEVSNDEPGTVLAFSLRPGGEPANPVFWDGSLNRSQAAQGRTNRALSGYVCNVPQGC